SPVRSTTAPRDSTSRVDHKHRSTRLRQLHDVPTVSNESSRRHSFATAFAYAPHARAFVHKPLRLNKRIFMSNSHTDRRQFLQLLGLTAVGSTLNANIAKALAIPANHRTGTIHDVEHIVILMQENRPFDHHFGTLRGVRGFSDPRAVNIHLPLQGNTGTTPASVFLQPAGAANEAAGFAVPPGTVGGP